MKAEAKKVGRPKKTTVSKTLGVTIPISIFTSELFKAKTRYSSFSQYVNYLIDKDLRS
jgi:hypothetical protein